MKKRNKKKKNKPLPTGAPYYPNLIPPIWGPEVVSDSSAPILLTGGNSWKVSPKYKVGEKKHYHIWGSIDEYVIKEIFQFDGNYYYRIKKSGFREFFKESFVIPEHTLEISVAKKLSNN